MPHCHSALFRILSLMCITTDNVADIVLGIRLLVEKLNDETEEVYEADEVHQRCIAHIINLAAKENLTTVRQEVAEISSAIN